ncbi:methyltransferase [Scytonema sp. NUACC26]|uniref:methyltransferase n=1 Tax=Scytonema sp. NUACC26 TaxID=3140176 RepID=UPI0034DBE137
MSQAQTNNNPEVSASTSMLEMISSFWVSQTIYAAVKLGIADYLQEQPRTAGELAEMTNTHAPSLYRLLRALTSVGIFTEDENHRFGLTRLGETLCTDCPGSLRFFAMIQLGQEHYRAWGNLLHSIKTGEVAFDNLVGMNVWDYYVKNPENGKVFEQAMTNMTGSQIEAIMASYDFSELSLVVDVGGGQGSLLTTILKAYPELKGILFDTPTTIENVKPRLQANSDVGNRCTAVSGNFFESVPSGGDAYLMKFIIHDWDDEKAIAILKNCYRVMPENSKLLLFETIIPLGNEPFFGKLLDINMLVMTGGRERTESEYQVLLQAAGFQLNKIISTPSPLSIIEAVKCSG